jgi:acyl carrier protein
MMADLLGLPKEQVVDQLVFRDVDTWDSLRQMEMIAALEREFSVELTFDDIVAMQSMGAVREVLESKGRRTP